MKVSADAYTIPTDAPESDGTFEWDSTTIVVVEVADGDVSGLGYTYGPPALVSLIEGTLAGSLDHMVGAVRNMGPWGLAMYAVSAVDVALWDLRARRLGVSLVELLGRRRDAVEIYGSGGFCSYSDEQLREQLGGWASEGFSRVKMKVGRDAERDPHRVAVAREAIGDDVELMIDANGAWTLDQAVVMAERLAPFGWVEEPVSSDDVDGLRILRERLTAAVAAGEYETSPYGFARLLSAVDVLQADVTRCGGITGFLQAGALAAAHNTPLSAHCAPNLSAHVMAAVPHARHIEYFHDHVRIEHMLFDGCLEPRNGCLVPDPSRPGHGLEFKRADAERFRA